jgi:Flp pilus assembly protein TadG
MAPLRVFRRRRDAKGANLIEAAIITPLVLLVTFAIVDFGAIFYIWLTLQNGVSQATRFGVTGNTTGGMTREQSVRQALIENTPTLTLQDNGPDSYIIFSNMPVGGTTWSTGSLGAEGAVGKVTVRYTWTLWTPLVRVFFPSGQLTVTAESAMTSERRFL